MRTKALSPDLFVRNRSKLKDCLRGDEISLSSSNPLMHRNGDTYYPYRQDSDFFYLSGITQEGSILALTTSEEVLFIREPSGKSELWTGPLHSLEEAGRISGIRDVRWMNQLDFFLEEELDKCDTLYMDIPSPGSEERGERLSGAFLARKISSSYPAINRQSLHHLIGKLRTLKEKEEIEAISFSAGITARAFQRILKTLRPGMTEYQLEAEITAEFISGGAMGHAYEPIIASGKNALTLHYVRNSDLCRAGNLVLMDFGAEVNNYAADCTRTLPVSGRFSMRQRQLYDATFRVFEKARALMRSGILMNDFHRQVGSFWEEEHISLGLYSLRDARAADESEPLWKKYYMHGTSHSLGLDVHDPFDRSSAFEPGMVLTCEPAIYIAEEDVGIRLENDILITEGDPVDLTWEIPMEAEEIEELMAGRGIDE